MKKIFLIILILSGFLWQTEAQQVEVRVSRPGVSVNIDHGHGYRTTRHRRSNGRYYYRRHYYATPQERDTYRGRGHYHRPTHRGHGYGNGHNNGNRNNNGNGHDRHDNDGHRRNR